jgi:hypothetical protein
MSGYDHEQLGRLIGTLVPAPQGWVQAAQELPAVRRGLDQLVARARADADARAAILADLEAALVAEGVEPEPQVLEHARRLLSDQ